MALVRRLNLEDVIAATLFGALAVFILIQPFVSRAPRLSPGDPGPWLLPSLYGVGLLVLSAALLWRAVKPKPLSRETLEAVTEYRAEFAASDASVEPAEAEQRMMPRLIAVALLSALYTWSFQHLGFYIATGAFLILSMLALSSRGLRSTITVVIISVLTTGVVGLVLTNYLEVSLPRGTLF